MLGPLLNCRALVSVDLPPAPDTMLLPRHALPAQKPPHGVLGSTVFYENEVGMCCACPAPLPTGQRAKYTAKPCASKQPPPLALHCAFSHSLLSEILPSLLLPQDPLEHIILFELELAGLEVHLGFCRDMSGMLIPPSGDQPTLFCFANVSARSRWWMDR